MADSRSGVARPHDRLFLIPMHRYTRQDSRVIELVDVPAKHQRIAHNAIPTWFRQFQMLVDEAEISDVSDVVVQRSNSTT